MGALTRLTANDIWQRAAINLQSASARRSPDSWHVDRDAHGRVEVCDAGTLRLARIRANPMCVEHIRGSTAPNAPGLYKVILQVSGRSLLEQCGREVMLTAGTWTLYRGGQPFTLVNLERCEQRMLVAPKAELWGDTLDLESLALRPYGDRDRMSHQLSGVLDAAFGLASSFGSAAAVEVAAAAVHLSRLALMENAGVKVKCLRAELTRDRIVKYIDRNLRDSALSVQTIAAALNCSKRYIHKVFAAQDESIGQYILNRRLARCMQALTEPVSRRRSIGEIAYSWGFNSLSHFGKAFSARYGVTPSQQRLGADSTLERNS